MTTDHFSRTQAAGATDAQTADNTAPGRADLELHFTRMFNAPRSVVFRAWTDPEQAAHWYGPKDFTVDIIEMDGSVSQRIYRGSFQRPRDPQNREPHSER